MRCEQFAGRSCRHADAALCLTAGFSPGTGSRSCRAPPVASEATQTCRRQRREGRERTAQAAGRPCRRAGSQAAGVSCLGRM